MTSLAFWREDRSVNRLDPRARLIAGFLLCGLIAFLQRPEAAWMALLFGAVAVCAARLPWSGLWPRLLALNVFMGMLFVVLPWSVPGEVVWPWGPFAYSKEGVALALLITCKGNAMMLLLSAWISTMDTASLGHALQHLRVPDKLVHLLIFTVRYLEVFHREQRRLWRAAKVRGFVPRANRHTYRTLARLVGMLLFRSLERSEKVLAAMKARGYRGQFYLLRHFAFHRRDGWFAMVTLGMAVTLACLEWIR